jgi:hypothetical protein
LEKLLVEKNLQIDNKDFVFAVLPFIFELLGGTGIIQLTVHTL